MVSEMVLRARSHPVREPHYRTRRLAMSGLPMKGIRALPVFCGLCCPAVAQSILNMSVDLVRLGIASSNLVPNQPGLDAGPLFFRAVSYAQANKIDRVIADAG